MCLLWDFGVNLEFCKKILILPELLQEIDSLTYMALLKFRNPLKFVNI